MSHPTLTHRVLLVGIAVLIPDPELRWLGQSAFSAAAFVSNFFFYFKTKGYFGATAELQPLLNTWSLAVEEQFYLIWPVILLMTHRVAIRGKRRTDSTRALIGVVGLLAIASLLAAQVLVGRNQSAVFYLMPFRLWELAAGALLALATPRLPTLSRRTAAAFGVVGVVLITASSTMLGAATLFPGVSAAPTVIGTVMLIIAGSSPANPVARFFAIGPLVWVGKLSYSWYLIHWPMLTFARILTLEADLLRDTIIAVVSLLIAWISYKFVEQPFRVQRWAWLRGNGQTITVGFAVLAVVAGLGLITSRYSYKVSLLNVPPAVQTAQQENRTAHNACPLQPTGGPEPVDCSFGDGDSPSLLLLGDSHALAVLPMMTDVAAELGWKLEVLWDAGCPFVIEYVAPPGTKGFSSNCTAENELRMQYIEDNHEQIGGVFITARASSISGASEQAGKQVDPQVISAWQNAVRATAIRITALDIPLVQMLDVPRFTHDVPTCILRLVDDCDVDTATAVLFRAPTADAETRALAGLDNATIIDPFDSLCNKSICSAGNPDEVIYRDRDHLSTQGAELLRQRLRNQIISVFASDT